MKSKIFQWTKIKKVTKIKSAKTKVYNIECSPNNNYFANGLLVHNCFSQIQKVNTPSFSLKLHAVNYRKLIDAIKGTPTHARG